MLQFFLRGNEQRRNHGINGGKVGFAFESGNTKKRVAEYVAVFVQFIFKEFSAFLAIFLGNSSCLMLKGRN